MAAPGSWGERPEGQWAGDLPTEKVHHQWKADTEIRGEGYPIYEVPEVEARVRQSIRLVATCSTLADAQHICELHNSQGVTR